MAEFVDVCINSEEVGFEKPDPRIFECALERFGVMPSEAIHVGDQYYSDVQGALRSGLQPVLLDREKWHIETKDCTVIQSLSGIKSVLRL